MITGTVTADREATIRLRVRGPSGQHQKIDMDCADTEALVGMALMDGYKLTVEDIYCSHLETRLCLPHE